MTWLKELFSTLISVLSDAQNWIDLLLAVVATWIAVNQRREQKYDIRVENLRKMVKSIRMERYEYSRESLEYYREKFRKLKQRGKLEDAVVDQVLFREGWVQSPDDDHFLALGEVKLNLADGLDQLWDSRRRNPRPRFLPTPREGYAENAKFHCDVNLMNLPLYGLGGVHVEMDGSRRQSVTLDIIKGRYYDFYDTCEVLSAETAYRRRIQMKPNPMRGRLPLRDRRSNVFDFTNRFAGIGVIVLTILENVEEEDGRRRNFFLLHKRSAKGVAEGGNSYHAVPAGSYQPATVEFPETVDAVDRSLHSTVIREFGEELLGEEEFSDLFNSKLVADYGKVPMAMFLGVGLDPLNTKTEIMGCLRLDVNETPLFGGKRTRREIEAGLISTYEGAVSLKELSEPMIAQYRDNPMSIPSFRQILTVIGQHPKIFGVETAGHV